MMFGLKSSVELKGIESEKILMPQTMKQIFWDELAKSKHTPIAKNLTINLD